MKKPEVVRTKGFERWKVGSETITAFILTLKGHSHCARSRAATRVAARLRAALRRDALIVHVQINDSIHTERVVKQSRAAPSSKNRNVSD